MTVTEAPPKPASERRAARPPILVHALTKRFGSVTAVDDLSFEIRAGTVTGFLGANGAGKTTTLRMLLGLTQPSAGHSLLFGQVYRDLTNPARLVGAVLDVTTSHPGRTARNHLRWMAQSMGAPTLRIDEVLATVDLSDAADRAIGEFSLGMRQRLAMASALLGDPRLLVLDEPGNGLDPAGIRWLREAMRTFAADGGTVFISSHQLGEIAQVADEVVVIDKGRLIAQCSVDELTGPASGSAIVRTPDAASLQAAIEAEGGVVSPIEGNAVRVTGLPLERIGEIAATGGWVLHELSQTSTTLEDMFFSITRESATKEDADEGAAAV